MKIITVSFNKSLYMKINETLQSLTSVTSVLSTSVICACLWQYSLKEETFAKENFAESILAIYDLI